ncbi:hypothetical protein KCP70_09280 [Salmonella enterica subsp. enterica]|nr:hypothetical protein KCP70_09280 [Salmonella enterica subsp. enterica]
MLAEGCIFPDAYHPAHEFVAGAEEHRRIYTLAPADAGSNLPGLSHGSGW